jgi:hypothetical protein
MVFLCSQIFNNVQRHGSFKNPFDILMFKIVIKLTVSSIDGDINNNTWEKRRHNVIVNITIYRRYH